MSQAYFKTCRERAGVIDSILYRNYENTAEDVRPELELVLKPTIALEYRGTYGPRVCKTSSLRITGPSSEDTCEPGFRMSIEKHWDVVGDEDREDVSMRSDSRVVRTVVFCSRWFRGGNSSGPRRRLPNLGRQIQVKKCEMSTEWVRAKCGQYPRPGKLWCGNSVTTSCSRQQSKIWGYQCLACRKHSWVFKTSGTSRSASSTSSVREAES